MKQEDNPRVAIVVLNWNGRALLEEYLPSWIKYTPTDIAELIIVDNGSTDSSLDYLSSYPQIKVLALPKNYGFAEGYNRAIAELQHEIIVLLNSDVRLSENWLIQALTLLDDIPHIVAVQPKICSDREPKLFEYAGAAGGYIDRWGYPLCRGRILDTIEEDQGQYNDVKEIHWASGACLIVRRKAYLEAGGLDKDFFAHQEEIDLCWRMRNRGGLIYIAPEGKVYHLGGATLSQDNPQKSYLNFRNNLLMLYKHLPIQELLITLLVRGVLDFVASIIFLLQGKRGHCWAVWRAWASFVNQYPNFSSKRRIEQSLLKHQTKGKKSRLYISLIWQYYVCGHRIYSQLLTL